MRRRPRSSTESLFQSRFVGMSVLQGFGLLLISLAIFAVAYSRGQGEADARAYVHRAGCGSIGAGAVCAPAAVVV
jgi:hypothetical protein